MSNDKVNGLVLLENGMRYCFNLNTKIKSNIITVKIVMDGYEFSFKKPGAKVENFHVPVIRRKFKSTIKLSNSKVVNELGIKEFINDINQEGCAQPQSKIYFPRKVKSKMPWQHGRSFLK